MKAEATMNKNWTVTYVIKSGADVAKEAELADREFRAMVISASKDKGERK